MTVMRQRRLSAGLEIHPDGIVHARVWAPARKTVDVVLDANRARTWRLAAEEDGYFAGEITGLKPGDRYWLRLDGLTLRPDPASRYQPDGPHGASAVVDPGAFPWTDGVWRGVEPDGQVLYEMHVGTFTPEGTWASAAGQLERLADLGITVIEMMPVGEFAGRYGWGYDGVNLYAPTHLYGTPDDLRRFVDRAHGLGLGVILDVVYNPVGPDGNYLSDFSPDYFTSRYKNDWGEAINFEGPAGARDFFVENAGYWIDEFHFDGLRFDATQDIKDASAEHAVASMVRRAREAAGRRRVYLVAENEPQDTRIVRDPARGGYGADALWNDDYHHAAVVALLGRREAYYRDYAGSSQELLSCAKYGYLYQGQYYSWQKQRRGTPSLDLPPHAFVTYLENHDQVANTAFGRRLTQSAAPARLRALTALTLLGPGTPLLFQGQEYGSTSPFLYFADHKPELQGPIESGRLEFLSQFQSLADADVVPAIPSPVAEQTFAASKLDPAEHDRRPEWTALHRDLLGLRRSDPVVRRAGRDRPDGAVLGPDALVLRYQGGDDGDRLLVVNLGIDLELQSCAEPLIAPPADAHWELLWSSESPRYGGSGTPALGMQAVIRLPAQSAVLLRSVPGAPAGAGPTPPGRKDSDAH